MCEAVRYVRGGRKNEDIINNNDPTAVMMADRWKTFQSKYGFSFFLRDRRPQMPAFFALFLPPDCLSELSNIINQSANVLSH